MVRRILILDCTPQDEPSEGRLLKEFLKICKLYKPSAASSLYFRVRSKKEFLRKLSTRKRYDIIHICAHGSKRGSRKVYLGNGRTWRAYPEEIAQTRHRASIVFLNACVSGRVQMANSFHYTEHFLAPSSEVMWDDAALFALVFYKRYLIDAIEMDSACKFAAKHTKTGKDYLYYWEA